jgi:hypothetical protein
MKEGSSHFVVTDATQLPAPPPGFTWAKLEDVMGSNSRAPGDDAASSKVYKQVSNTIEMTTSQSFDDVVLDIELRLDMGQQEIGEIETFITKVVEDLAMASLLSTSAFQVTEVRADGGIVVDIALSPSARDLRGRSTLQISDDLSEQSREQSSPLRRGHFTRRISGFWIKAPRHRSDRTALTAAPAPVPIGAGALPPAAVTMPRADAGHAELLAELNRRSQVEPSRRDVWWRTAQ